MGKERYDMPEVPTNGGLPASSEAIAELLRREGENAKFGGWNLSKVEAISGVPFWKADFEGATLSDELRIQIEEAEFLLDSGAVLSEKNSFDNPRVLMKS